MVFIVLLVSEFQIRGPHDDIAKRVIRVFLFGIIKLSLLCLVSYLCSMYWNLIWKLFGMVSLCTLNRRFRTWYKLSLYTFKMPFSSNETFDPSVFNGLNLLHFNISSLSYNVDQLHTLLSNLKINFDILGITESWLWTGKKDNK